MTRIFVSLTFIVLTLAACSDDASKNAAAVPEPASKSKPKVPDVLNPVLQTGLGDVEKKVQAKDYEAAVGSLVMLKDMQASPKDEQAYRKLLGETAQQLNQAAMAGDERARVAHQMLGRMMMGR
jgi:hypothetical protein